MKSKVSRILLVTAVLVVGAWGLSRQYGFGGLGSEELGQAAQNTIEAQQDPGVHTEFSMEPVEPTQFPSNSPETKFESLSELSDRLYAAESASEAQGVIDDLYLMGYQKQAKEYELLLSGVCTQYSTLTRIPNRSKLAVSLISYCDSFEIEEDRFTDIVATSSVQYQEDLNAIRNEFTTLTNDEGSKRLSKTIENAQSWHELEIVKNLILLSGADRYSINFSFYLGQNEWLAGEQARQVQAAALTLLQCELYGAGCRAGSLRTYEHCLLNGSCEQDWSVVDYYWNNLSVMEAEQLDLILYYLRSLRPP